MTVWNYRKWISQSIVEYNKYKKTNELENLAQAGEKVWNAFNIIIQNKVKRKIRSYGEMKIVVGKLFQETGSELLLTVKKDAYDLHVFFYQGWTDDPTEIEELYIKTKNNVISLAEILKR